MAIIDDVEEPVRGIRPGREIADFVNDDHRGVDVARQGVSELAAPKRGGPIIDQFSGRDKQRIDAVLDRAVGDGHGQVRFPPSRLSPKDETPALGHEVRRQGRAQERQSAVD